MESTENSQTETNSTPPVENSHATKCKNAIQIEFNSVDGKRIRKVLTDVPPDSKTEDEYSVFSGIDEKINIYSSWKDDSFILKYKWGHPLTQEEISAFLRSRLGEELPLPRIKNDGSGKIESITTTSQGPNFKSLPKMEELPKFKKIEIMNRAMQEAADETKNLTDDEFREFFVHLEAKYKETVELAKSRNIKLHNKLVADLQAQHEKLQDKKKLAASKPAKNKNTGKIKMTKHQKLCVQLNCNWNNPAEIEEFQKFLFGSPLDFNPNHHKFTDYKG